MSQRLRVVTYLIAVSVVVCDGSLSASICLATVHTTLPSVRQRYSDSAVPPFARHIRQIGINMFRGTCAGRPRSCCPTADSKQPSIAVASCLGYQKPISLVWPISRTSAIYAAQSKDRQRAYEAYIRIL